MALTPSDELIEKVFARIDRRSLGFAVGLVLGATLFLATVILILKGGEPVGPNLSLLGQFIPGYSVTWPGSLIGGIGGFVGGFALGWGFGFLSNLSVVAYIYASAFWVRLNQFLDE